MDEPAKTLGETTSEEHDCVRELWWAATGCYFSEDSLDKAEKASIAFLESRSLRVIDPAKVLVLERRESVPEEEGFYLGVHGRIFRWIRKRDRCIDIDNLNAKGFVTLCPPDLAFDEFPCEAIFGPIQLPATEGR